MDNGLFNLNGTSQKKGVWRRYKTEGEREERKKRISVFIENGGFSKHLTFHSFLFLFDNHLITYWYKDLYTNVGRSLLHSGS